MNAHFAGPSFHCFHTTFSPVRLNLHFLVGVKGVFMMVEGWKICDGVMSLYLCVDYVCKFIFQMRETGLIELVVGSLYFICCVINDSANRYQGTGMLGHQDYSSPLKVLNFAVTF
jgi:hypothetical protein